jgi:FKBP-type peptidyl-prolyl cis-trans isomerase SlyD
MEITKNKAVTVEYTLHDADGALLDTSSGRGPMTYIQGSGSMIPGFEAALEGKGAKEKFSFVVEPAQGYGEWDQAMLFPVPRQHFNDIDGLKEGMGLTVQAPDGMALVLVKEIGDEMVTLDANHPLAGKQLFFDVEVLAVRDATEAELSAADCQGSCSPSCCTSCGSSCGEE